MATISFENLKQSFYLLGQQVNGSAVFDGKSSIFYSYISSNFADIDLVGNGFTYSGDTPTGGVATTLGYDLNNDNSDAPDLTISGLSLNISNFASVFNPSSGASGSQNSLFWRLVLGGNDTISLGSGAEAGGFFINFAGDARNLAEPIQFFAGNDTITGNAGGSNTLAAIFGDVLGVSGGASAYGGNDTIKVTAYEVSGDAEAVSGGFLSGGDDLLEAQSGGAVSIFYGDAREANTSNPSTIVGGNDTIALSANSTAFGDVFRSPGVVIGGDDLISGGSGDNLIFGDVEEISGSGSLVGGDDKLYGGAGNDIIYGDWKTLSAQAGARGGNDYIDGGIGFDTMVGGSGNDSYVVDSAGDIVDESLAGSSGSDTVISATVSVDLANITLFQGDIENITLQGNANLTVTGNSLANTITGNAGGNVLNGADGADTLIGGTGNDTYVVDIVGDVVVEAASAGSDTVRSSISYTLLANVENLTLIGTAAINGTGNALANTIVGNGAANILNGGAGADRMIGGAGSDTYYVDNIGDKAVETNGAAGVDLVVASVSYSLGGSELENLTLTGTASLKGTGNSIANVITGNSGANVLDGGAGADTMIGGAGSDTYFVDNVGDRAGEANGAVGTDLVYASVSFSLAGSELENLTLMGSGALSGTGNGIANAIRGNTSANVINGGLGNDTLTGLAGKDTFVFSTALGAGNVDRITDFSAADDTIQLSKGIFTALSAGTLAAGAFKDLSVAGANVDADDRILYNKTTGALSYDADGSGSKAAVQFATIDTKVALTAADFFVA